MALFIMLLKKLPQFCILSLFAGLSLQASASVITSPFTLDFEGIGNGIGVGNFYNGGAGADYGVAFGNNGLVLTDSDAGGTGNFAHQPSGDSLLFFLNAPIVLDYTPGFNTGFSFFYSSSSSDAKVSIWDETGGQGNELAVISLPRNYQDDNCIVEAVGDFCHFDIGLLSFADDSVAKSVLFTGVANQVAFDNITFGSIDPTGTGTGTIPVPVPVPASITLLGLGLAGLGLSRKKQHS